MKKNITFFLAILFTLASGTKVFAQTSFSIKYQAEGSIPSPSIKVTAEYDITTCYLTTPPSPCFSGPVQSMIKHIGNGQTALYVSTSPNPLESYNIHKLTVAWTVVDPIGHGVYTKKYTFNREQISDLSITGELSVNAGNDIVRLKRPTNISTNVVYTVVLNKNP